MNLTGLRADQAPPISAPLRFFLTAPLFAVFAGFLMFLSEPASLMSRFSSETIAIAHAITIGFLGFTMLGAMTQMLPVLAGVKIYKVKFVAFFSYISLVIGLIFMIFGLYFSKQTLSSLAVISLTIGFLTLLIPMIIALAKVENYSSTVKAIAVSISFAVISVVLGATLLSSYALGSFSSYHAIIANIHSVWAIFGFAGILIIGVAFQVLPMFYVAPRFKRFCKKRVVLLISIGLLLWLVSNIFYPEYSIFAKIWVGLFFWAFSTTIWIKLNRRRRPVSDITVWYWRAATIYMTLGLFSWVIDSVLDDKYIVEVSVLIGGGFILSIMSGMLYKIVPFLVWFHLNSRGYMNIPTMTEMIDKNLSKVQFILFQLSIIGFVLSYEFSYLMHYSALAFVFSMIVLEYNIINPTLIYIKTIKTKPDFDMSAFNMEIK